jgi:glutamine synthetase
MSDLSNIQNSIDQVLKSIAENNVETVRVVFVDQHGITRGKTIMASAMTSAFMNGVSMPSTLLLKDTSHATVFPVWEEDAGFGKGVMTGASDFLMMPDPVTFQILPWTDHENGSKTGWLISDICYSDGRSINISTRHILRQAINRLEAQNLTFICGLEVEFYVLNIEKPNLDHEHSRMPHDQPETSLLSHGYQHLTENRADELDEVMELIRANSAILKLPLRSMESEFGPSQFEITFEPMSALNAADTMILFRNMVKQVCKRNGYHATFMCRPGFKNSMGSGWHLHQSIVELKNGTNLIAPGVGEELSEFGANWIAGLLTHASESCILTTPTINGYKRYQPFALAPDRIQWGHDNRGAMLRYLGGPMASAYRIENRVGEPAANPYLYIASQILSGDDGVANKLVAPAPVEQPYVNDVEMLPGDLGAAISAFNNSTFYRESLGDEFVDYFTHIKTAEWRRYLTTVSEWEHREYFSLF